MENDAYQKSGIDYGKMDPTKVSAQQAAAQTAGNLKPFGYEEVAGSRGESAYVWDQGSTYGAFVVEGLGTKNLVADEVREFSGRTHYDQIAQDTIAMIVNDLLVVGALPTVVNAYWAVGSSDWHDDQERMQDLVTGWRDACTASGACWGGGETPTLKGIIEPGTIDLGGAAVGLIADKNNLVLGDKLQAGDHIVLIESSGVHSNGITLTRQIADGLPDRFATMLADGSTYGESLLTPTHLYVQLVRAMQLADIDIHYMANITGHGWRKIMRAAADFTYRMHTVPPVSPLFDFIQEKAPCSLQDMYGNYNMGAGFAVYVAADDVAAVLETAKASGLQAWDAGVVEEGPKSVVIEPVSITFEGDTLGVRA